MARTTRGLRRKCSPSANRRMTCLVAAQSLWRHHEQRVPQLIAARADQCVRAQTAHAVSENDDVSRREIVIVRIDIANRLLEFLPQLKRVEQHRRARAVQEMSKPENARSPPGRDASLSLDRQTRTALIANRAPSTRLPCSDRTARSGKFPTARASKPAEACSENHCVRRDRPRRDIAAIGAASSRLSANVDPFSSTVLFAVMSERCGSPFTRR